MSKLILCAVAMSLMLCVTNSNAGDSEWWKPYVDDPCTLGLWHFDDVMQNSTVFLDDDSNHPAADEHPARDNNGIRVSTATTVEDSGAGYGVGMGSFGKCLRGNGVVWDTNIPYDGNDMDFGINFTIEMWIKPAQSDLSGLKGLFNHGGSEGFQIGLYEGKLFADCRTYEYQYGFSNSSFEADKWYHIAVVYWTGYLGDWEDAVVIYINGQQDALLGYPTFCGDWRHPTYHFRIGELRNVDNDDFYGSIDEIRYSNCVRTFAVPPCGGAVLSAADFNTDCIVNFKDLKVITESWLATGTGDINGDSLINFKDVARLAKDWMKCVNPSGCL